MLFIFETAFRYKVLNAYALQLSCYSSLLLSILLLFSCILQILMNRKVVQLVNCKINTRLMFVLALNKTCFDIKNECFLYVVVVIQL